ncbi:MAG: carbamoyl phosphate synthase large subunit [Paenibacillus sp.]|nr:carbamoyl phosphate synthase large subunit [Paenibacillus sp.]
MKSTGEVMGRDLNFAKALYKGFIGSGMKIPPTGALIATIADKDKEEAIELFRGFFELGYKIVATGGTADALEKAGLRVERVNKLSEGPERDGFRIRREAVENGVVCMTSLDTVRALLHVLNTINFSSRAMPNVHLSASK